MDQQTPIEEFSAEVRNIADRRAERVGDEDHQVEAITQQSTDDGRTWIKNRCARCKRPVVYTGFRWVHGERVPKCGGRDCNRHDCTSCRAVGDHYDRVHGEMSDDEVRAEAGRRLIAAAEACPSAWAISNVASKLRIAGAQIAMFDGPGELAVARALLGLEVDR